MVSGQFIDYIFDGTPGCSLDGEWVFIDAFLMVSGRSSDAFLMVSGRS